MAESASSRISTITACALTVTWARIATEVRHRQTTKTFYFNTHANIQVQALTSPHSTRCGWMNYCRIGFVSIEHPCCRRSPNERQKWKRKTYVNLCNFLDSILTPYLITLAMTWSEAKDVCEQNGMYLVDFYSTPELNDIMTATVGSDIG